MQKFRMLLDSKQGDHLSNAMGWPEAVCAADHVHLLTGTEPEVIPDTRSMRRELQAVDAKAALLEAAKPRKPGEMPLAICWNRAIPMTAAMNCNCPSCQAVREAVASSKACGTLVEEKVLEVKQEKAAAAEIEHPYFACPPLKHGMATIEEEEPEAVVSFQGSVFREVKARPTLMSRICGLVSWFFGTEEGL